MHLDELYIQHPKIFTFTKDITFVNTNYNDIYVC